MSNFFLARTRLIGAMVASLMLLAACGGGGSSSDGVGSGGTGFISGVVEKGPIGNAAVTAYGITGGLVGAQVGATTSDVNGNFTVNIGSHAGPMMLQAGGGSYVDEATGTAMAMATGDVMTAVIPAVAAGATASGIHVTPVTSMAQTRAIGMSGGTTDANIAAANTAMGNYFSVTDILHTQPMNPLVTGSGAGASQDARNYGMTLAAMSQYAKHLNMTNSSAMVTAMMNDASDGIMDGKKSGSQISMTMGGMMGSSMMTPTAGTSDLGAAMTAFTNSPANRSGMTAADMTVLIQKLSMSNGHI